MANIKDTAATSALNEEEYINELYDTKEQGQNQLLKEHFDSGNAVLDNGQQATQSMADSYVDRTQIEAGAVKGLYGDGGVSAGAQAQVLLDQENTQRRNITALRDAQNAADAKFERQRQLLASQYEADIRQAQADNDLERAQALYEAAKEEEAQLLELQKQGALLMADEGSDGGFDAIAAGQTLQRDTASESWGEVLKNEDALNAIYDAQLESQRAQLEGEYAQTISELEAQRQAGMKQTDEQLTSAYVDALKSRKNNAEVRTAAGQSSGATAQGRLKENSYLQDTLTALRKSQLEADANTAGQHFQLEKQRGQAERQAQNDVDAARAKALFEAAENEEQTLIGNQEFVGKQAAANGDYSILAKLYGLTEEQMQLFAPGVDYGSYVAAPEKDAGAGTEEAEGIEHIYSPLNGSYGAVEGVSPSGAALNNGWVITPGKTPVSQEGLAAAVESGRVQIAQTENGLQYIYNPANTLR